MKCYVCDRSELSEPNLNLTPAGVDKKICKTCSEVLTNPDDPRFDKIMKTFMSRQRAN